VCVLYCVKRTIVKCNKPTDNIIELTSVLEFGNSQNDTYQNTCSDNTQPSTGVRDKYIKSLIEEYCLIHNENVSDVQIKYNYLKTTSDIRELKMDILINKI
jgi:hypothetical protein